ncbi:MAG: NAD(P)/FAD-dependent oxidoreductase [Vulcanisaeta sp.]|nr:NAD(P)/FAD-dependent oxidoreductase [Vulcanisaeta sp.]
MRFIGWKILPPLPRVTGQVKVIDGGVMGLKTASVLASAGLEVELYEKEDRLGGQLNWLFDPWKRMEFLQLLNCYINELKRLNVKIRLNTEVKDCDTDCIWAVPEETQPRFIEYRGLKILIDSNLYAYQDYAFEWVRRNEVYVTERSLRELDLARRYLLIRAYEGVGVKVISDKEAGSIKADITMREFRRDQPNLGKSISRGYWLARNYILTKITQ